jgi:hypothetical protein
VWGESFEIAVIDGPSVLASKNFSPCSFEIEFDLAFALVSSMPWYYKSDGLENGPVSDAELEALVRGGKIISPIL